MLHPMKTSRQTSQVYSVGARLTRFFGQLLLASALGACTSASDTAGSDAKIAPAIGAAAAGAAGQAGPMGDFFYKVIGESLQEAEKAENLKADRASFLSAISEEVYHKMNREAMKRKIRPYNVAICAGDLNCSLVADEGLHYAVKTFNFGGRYYTLWAMRGAYLDNPSHGGWDNWALRGCHDHEPGQGARKVRFRDTAWISRIEEGRVGCR